MMECILFEQTILMIMCDMIIKFHSKIRIKFLPIYQMGAGA